MELPGGSTLFTPGDHGDSFYILDDGTLEIDLPEGVKREDGAGVRGRDRAAPRHSAHRDGACGDRCPSLALDREAFLAAVSGHARARGHADSIVFARLDPANANAL